MGRFNDLITKGEKLRRTLIGDPRYELWVNDIKEQVVPYGNSTMNILENAISSTTINYMGENYNDEAIENIIILLNSLNERAPQDTKAQDAIINQKVEEAAQTVNAKLSDITVHGDATFGDNSPITKLTVSEVLSGIYREVEAMPDSEQRTHILDGLKAVMTNPVFASISATMLTDIMRRLINGGN